MAKFNLTSDSGSVLVENSGPRNQALTSAQKDGFGRLKAHGVMEWWSNGISITADQKRIMVYIYVPLYAIKTDLIPPNAGFQYSNTPLFHYPTAIIYAKANLLRPGSEDQAFDAEVNIKSRRHRGGCRLAGSGEAKSISINPYGAEEAYERQENSKL